MASPQLQLPASLANLPLSVLRKKYDDLTPEERRALGFVRPATDAEAATYEHSQQRGVPTDFAGPVFANPDNRVVSDDTASGVPVTRLPDGVSFQQQNFTGKMPADVSNPAAAQILPSEIRTVAAHSSAPTFDAKAFATEGGTAPTFDASAFATEGESSGKSIPDKDQPGILDREIPLTDHWAATESGLQSVGRGLRDAAKGTSQLFTDPQDATEKAIFAAGPGALPIYRMLRGMGHTAEQASQVASAIHDINQSPDPAGTYAKVAQETAGQGAGQALLALGTEGLAKAAPNVLDTVTSPTKMGAPVRSVVRGANQVLSKAPGSVGASVGAAAGHMTGIPGAAELGAGAGYALGKEVLPQLRIPGENLGLPSRVAGGPSTAPQFEAAPTPSQANALAQIPLRTAPETGGTAAGASQDTTMVQQAREELGKDASASDVLQRAQQLKTQSANALASRAKVGDTSAATLQKQLYNAFDVKPFEPTPGTPLKDQIKASIARQSLPEDFTPVKSRALAGYKYDPETQIFESITNDKQHYVHGGVTPDMVTTFENANSPGEAWGVLRDGPGVTRLGKVVNGKFVPANPPTSLRSATPEDTPPAQNALAARSGNTATATIPMEAAQPATNPDAPDSGDLTDLLQESLRQALAKKAKR